MIGRPAFVSDRPDLSPRPPQRPATTQASHANGGAAMDYDILSDLLRTVRLSGAIFFDVDASSPWVAAAPPSRSVAAMVMPGAQHVIEYHVLVSGSCWARLTASEDEPVHLAAGSVVVFPQGDMHTLSSDPKMRAVPDLSVFEATADRDALPFYLDHRGGGTDTARIICGFLGCDIVPFNPLIASLPRLVHVADGYTAADGLLGQLVQAAVKEARDRRVGRGGILSKLSELIFIDVIRRYAEDLPAGTRGWLTGLREPNIGRALRLLHAEPVRDWTVRDLAREAGVSRTVLAERFTEVMGMPPMTYLLNWRMQLAASLLAGGAAPLARIAAEVGYESEAAFSRAFKRSTGVSPAKWRSTTATRPIPLADRAQA